jgi:hypothetical protein
MYCYCVRASISAYSYPVCSLQILGADQLAVEMAGKRVRCFVSLKTPAQGHRFRSLADSTAAGFSGLLHLIRSSDLQFSIELIENEGRSNWVKGETYAWVANALGTWMHERSISVVGCSNNPNGTAKLPCHHLY